MTVIFALSSVGYTSVTSRVTKVEDKQEALTAAVAAVDKTTAVQITALTKQVEEQTAQIKTLTAKVDDLTLIIGQNTKVYRDAMVRWNTEMRKR